MENALKSNLSQISDGNDQLVVFRLDQVEYALPINLVREIITLPKITRVPMAEQFVEGVFNSRGSIVPIINLEKIFNTYTGHRGLYERVIIVESKTRKYGILVDGVSEVIKIDSNSAVVQHAELTASTGSYTNGIIKTKDGRLIININTDGLYSDQP